MAWSKMWSFVVSFVAFVSVAAAQKINFPGGTGTRSLWIPYKTISGVPLASILGHDSSNNRTTYVLHCPTAQPECALSPKLTLTEGTDLVAWTSSTSGASVGTVFINCPLATSPVVCSQVAHGNGNIARTSQTIAASDIVYQEVNVTATSTPPPTTKPKGPKTTKATTTSTTSTTPTSNGVAEVTARSWVGAVGALGPAILALAAL